MIPTNITSSQILQAIRETDSRQRTVPRRQRSTKYCLVYGGNHYPPKYLLRVANEMANGEELWTQGGGKETNSFCERRGFKVIEHGGAPH